MTYEEMKRILASLPTLSILVVGDYFLDKYLVIDRSKDEPSLETGLTAYQVVDRRLSPGAAGTVTNNLRALGVGKVLALGIIGDDGEGLELERALKATGVVTDYLIKTPRRVTPTYTKPISRKENEERELNRLDIKNWSPTPKELEDQVIERLLALAEKVEAVIALDQVTEENHGVITQRVREMLAEVGRKQKDLIMYADSRAFIGYFRNVMVKCNQNEIRRIADQGYDPGACEEFIEKSALNLSRKTNRPVFVTLGERGQIVTDGTRVWRVPAIPVSGPIDIVGAGDSTTAGTVSALCAGASLEDAAMMGNVVASITIQQIGTTGTASPEQVLRRYAKYIGSMR